MSKLWNYNLNAPTKHNEMTKISKKINNSIHNQATANTKPGTTHRRRETYLQHIKGRSIVASHPMTNDPCPLGSLERLRRVRRSQWKKERWLGVKGGGWSKWKGKNKRRGDFIEKVKTAIARVLTSELSDHKSMVWWCHRKGMIERRHELGARALPHCLRVSLKS